MRFNDLMSTNEVMIEAIIKLLLTLKEVKDDKK
jgi:hypothetical protein